MSERDRVRALERENRRLRGQLADLEKKGQREVAAEPPAEPAATPLDSWEGMLAATRKQAAAVRPKCRPKSLPQHADADESETGRTASTLPDPKDEEVLEGPEDDEIPPDIAQHQARDVPSDVVTARVASIQRWVYREAIRASRQLRGAAIDIDDLASEGNIGAITAARRFDESRGVKFLSYASWWVRQGIKRAIANQDRTIRLPVYLAEGGRKIAENLPDETFRKANILVHLASRNVSFDEVLSVNDDDRTLEEILPNGEESTETSVSRASDAAELRRLLGELDPRQRMVLMLRAEGETLLSIGDKLGVSREFARQLEEAGLRHMRRLLARRGWES